MLCLKRCISIKAVSGAAKESHGRIGKENKQSLENKLLIDATRSKWLGSFSSQSSRITLIVFDYGQGLRCNIQLYSDFPVMPMECLDVPCFSGRYS